MTDNTTLVLVAVIVLVAVPLGLGLPVWIIGRLLRRSDDPLFDTPGTRNVPVQQLMESGWMSSKSNTLNARLAIDPEGLRFKIFSKIDYWPFAAIVRVDTPWIPFKTRVAFRKRGGMLSADVAGRDKARDLLRALPGTLPFTRRAAALRDGAG